MCESMISCAGHALAIECHQITDVSARDWTSPRRSVKASFLVNMIALYRYICSGGCSCSFRVYERRNMSCHALVTIQLANNDCMHTIARDITAGRPGASFTVLITAAALLLTSPPSNTMGCASKPSTPGMRLNLATCKEEGPPQAWRTGKRVCSQSRSVQCAASSDVDAMPALVITPARPVTSSLRSSGLTACQQDMCPVATPLSQQECAPLQHP